MIFKSRPYESPLRAEQAAATRDRIVNAAIELLQRGDSGDVSMNDVAEQAGVAVRTVYRAFPTRDDLFDGVLETIKQHFAAAAGPHPRSPDEFVATAPAAVRAVFAIEPLYRALFALAAERALHQRGATARQAAILEFFANDIDRLRPDAARRFVALIHLATSSTSVLFLKDYARLDAEDAGAAIQWALETIIQAIRDPDRRADLSTDETTT